MDVEAALSQLEHVAESVAKDGKTTRWYVFGSGVHRKASAPNDLDILVIYDDLAVATSLRKTLGTLPLPLHVLFLTEAEEREFDFIELQRAVCFFPK